MSTIAEFFARDPHDLSDQDLDKIIAEYRAKRHQFNTAGVRDEKPKGKTRKASVLDQLGEIKL